MTKDSKPFNPLELAKETEDIVIKDDARKYTAFYCTGVYGGISTGYTVGCCLRCIFCWASPSRDFPEKYGFSVNPEEAYSRLMTNALKRRVKRVRISGGEPTLGKN
ncbi:radical SAM protein, partial [candidate division WOR-3 bacterium]|nr:radical SAM protein [candidate division WOR-3 bacterium]